MKSVCILLGVLLVLSFLVRTGAAAEMKSKGPFCQSCGMPLEKPEQFGADSTGMRINDYCLFCYKDGEFTAPDITMQQMIGKCASIMARQGIMPEAEAKAMMSEVIPKLKRWQKK